METAQSIRMTQFNQPLFPPSCAYIIANGRHSVNTPPLGWGSPHPPLDEIVGLAGTPHKGGVRASFSLAVVMV